MPVPLLPHEVARQGLRPEWPPGLPPGCAGARALAEACWARRPRDRPSFAEVLATLEAWEAGAVGYPPRTPAAAAGAGGAGGSGGGGGSSGAGGLVGSWPAEQALQQQQQQRRRRQQQQAQQTPPTATAQQPR